MDAYWELPAGQKKLVDRLLADTVANGGLAPFDAGTFWKDQDLCVRDPFGAGIPQVPLGAICNHVCLFDELGVPLDLWRFEQADEAWASGLKCRYNDACERIVGRRLLDENPSDPTRRWPTIKGLHDIFEGENVWEGGPAGSWWLKQAANSPAELSGLLDRVEKRLENLRDFMLPANWQTEKRRLLALGCRAPLYRGQRGPCTFACSIFGAENLLLLYYDDPALMKRFSDLIACAILGRARILDDEAGFDVHTSPRGWGWWDDNCCLFTPEMYEFFAMPIHRAVFNIYSPGPMDRRYQHSDSDMAHLLPLIGELNLLGVNFGPTLTVRQIREYCPNAVIEGQLAPFTYSRNEEANIVAEFLRDFAQAKEKRGLLFATAGSVNAGTRLTSMRLAMAAIQRYGRY